MKKVMLLGATSALLSAARNKDRACSCKVIETTTTPRKTETYGYDYTLTLKKASFRTVFKACSHYSEEYAENDTTNVKVDTNCSIK